MDFEKLFFLKNNKTKLIYVLETKKKLNRF
jgi:hypothetical protein